MLIKIRAKLMKSKNTNSENSGIFCTCFQLFDYIIQFHIFCTHFVIVIYNTEKEFNLIIVHIICIYTFIFVPYSYEFVFVV